MPFILVTTPGGSGYAPEQYGINTDHVMFYRRKESGGTVFTMAHNREWLTVVESFEEITALIAKATAGEKTEEN